MKITAVLLLAALQVAAKGWGQDQISLSFSNAPLEQVFNAITAQTSIAFLYRSEYVKDKKVTVKITNASLKSVLEICLKDQKLVYQIIGKTVAIHPASKSNSVSGVENVTGTPPPIDIKGRIIDSKGEAIPNATVSVKGSVKNTVTNANGEFTLTGVDEDAVLIISHVQYEMESIVVKGNKNISISLQIKVNSLDEMQVIAYGTTTKRFSTGNIASVKADEIAKQPVTNPLLALQGRVAGLMITQSTGMPGSGVTVRIQGQNSLTKGNDPLYVIDGVPYISQFLPNLSNVLGGSGGVVVNDISAGGGNPLNLINPSDIESIEVLKDADATSIYGSRAANGAILITTKKGKAGKTTVDLNMQHGVGKVARELKLLNTAQYLEIRREAKANDGEPILPTDYDINGEWNTTRNTNWQKELLGGSASYTDAKASISGGTTNTQFFVGMGYHRETSVFPGNFSDKRASVHFNLNSVSPNQKFKYQLSGSYLSDNNQITSNDLTAQAMRLAPNAPELYNVDGSLNWAPISGGTSTWTNPLAYLLNKYNIKSNNLIANSIISYQLFNWLEVKTSVGYNNLQTTELVTSPLATLAPELRANGLRGAGYGNSSVSTWILEPQVIFKQYISHGKLEILAGLTYNRTQSNSQLLSANGFNSDLVLEDIRSAATVSPTMTIATRYKYNAVFGRLNYNWKEKYILNVTARRDGSSRFGSENLFHNFASIAGSWIFTNETFLKNQGHALSFGKVRASYGTTGSDQIGDYQFMNLYQPVDVFLAYQNSPGLTPDRLTNPYLQWEETRKLQFGLDLGFLKDRVMLTGNYYRNRSSNQLLSYALPIITGFGGQPRNLPATVQNSGWEFSVSSNNIISKSFNWSTSFNITIPKNKLVEYPNLESSSDANTYVIGEPVTIQKRFRFAGVNSTTGVYEFYNSKNELTSSPDNLLDNFVLVNTSPTIFGGIQNTFGFKGIEVTIFFQGVKQNANNISIGNTPGMFNVNQPAYILNRWQKSGDTKSIQQVSTVYSSTIRTPYDAAGLSDLVWADASFIRLKNISIAWQVPMSAINRLKLSRVRIYAQAQNLLTITSYKGLDPETRSSTSLPPLRVLTAGIQITF